jgi:flavodoxin
VNTLVVYFSKFGNTKHVAEAIGDALGSRGKVRLIGADQLTPDTMRDVDLVVMGTPTHNMNLPKAVRPILKGLPRRILSKTPVAAFDTSYKMADRNTPEWLSRFTAAPKLARALRKLGGKRILPPETFHVKDREGPLYEGELERARAWGMSILERLSSNGSD